MADLEERKPPRSPVIFMQEMDRGALEQEIARRAARRFSTRVLRAALFPEHIGKMAKPDGYAGVQGDCGDLITFYLRVANGQISEITFTTDGCDATIASGEVLASMVASKSLEAAQQVTAEELLTALDGLPPNHTHCAELAVSTLRQAIASYRGET